MKRKFPALPIFVGIIATLPAALIIWLRLFVFDEPFALSWGFVIWAVLYTLFVVCVVSAAIHASDPARRKWPKENRPHWRTAHRAVSPNGFLVAEIAQAMEHSMSNPTVGTLRISDGLELQQCSPAFIWSDDSRYLAIPRWVRNFASGRRQRLVIVDVEQRKIYTSPFSRLLLLPVTFERGKVEVLMCKSFGLTFGWKKIPLTVEIPRDLQTFESTGYQ